MTLLGDKYLADFPHYCKLVRSMIEERSRFSVDFFPSQKPFHHISVSQREQVCRDILDQISPTCLRVFVYELNPNAPGALKHADCLTRERGRYRLDTKGNGWFHFDSLLYSGGPSQALSEIRGSILLECHAESIPWKNILRYCYNPATINNDSVCCGKSVLAYVRKHAKERTLFVIIHVTNTGLDGFTIAAQKELILQIFDEAKNSSRLGKFQQICCTAHESGFNKRIDDRE